MTGIFQDIINQIGSLIASDIILYPVAAAVLCSLGLFLYQIVQGRG